MKGYIGYIRVSTVKQGTQGVSLQEQKDAILRYAAKHQFTISNWFEEMVTAGKQGRPEFTKAVKLLHSGKVRGIILHKLDRGARNLRDWATIGELSDQGLEIHFVNESLDLQSRGGRLSADIQAVVAADFIRNQREETKKGLYGRLKQGLYPWAAPLGYCDHGAGKVKTICNKVGPLVVRAFELYATGKFNFDTLRVELTKLGLSNKRGHPLSRNSLTALLNNPFYVGVIKIGPASQSFAGIHQPLIAKSLFDQVQRVLRGKYDPRIKRHQFQFSRMLTCRACKYSLIGEMQKGHTYYRCHSKSCKGTSLRESMIASEVERYLKSLQFAPDELTAMQQLLSSNREDAVKRQQELIKSHALRVNQIKARLGKLTDAYLDNLLEKAAFESRRFDLLLELKTAEENAANPESSQDILETALKNLELAATAWLSYENGFPDQKREMLKILTSNLWVSEKSLVIEPSLPFKMISERSNLAKGGPDRDELRTFWYNVRDSDHAE